MRFLLPLSVLFALVGAQFILLPTGFNATLEDPSKTEHRCGEFAIEPIVRSYIDKTEVIRQTCFPSRSKRIFHIAMFGAYIADRKKNEMKKMVAAVVEVYRSFLGNLTMTFDMFNAVFSYNATEFTNTFNYPLEKLEDAWWATGPKTVQCTSEGVLTLNTCGYYNPDRQWGALHNVVPLGRFSSRGTLYKARTVPEPAIFINNTMHTATECSMLASYFQCSAPTNLSCTVAKFRDCDEEVFLTPSKVYSRNFGPGTTVVAADTERYLTTINGTTRNQRMDHSRHVVLTLPVGSFAEFNGIKIDGRAEKNFNHFTVHHAPDFVSPLNTDDLDKLEAEVGKHPEIVIHRAIISSVPPKLSTSRFLKWIILGLLMLFCTASCCKSKRKRSAIHRNSVFYSSASGQVSFGNRNLAEVN